MAQIFANNVGSLLTAGATNVATTLSIDGGDAVNFPSPSGGDFFLATLYSSDINGREDTWEVVRVVARTLGSLTVVRGQEGTSARAWDSGTKLELRVTKGTLERYETAYTWGDHSLAGYAVAGVTLASYGITNGVSTTTVFGGDVTGTYDNLQVVNDSHTHDTRYYTEAEVDALLAGVSGAMTVQITSTNTLTEVNTHYYLTTGGLTLTLPASPGAGDLVGFSVGNFDTTVVARNGNKVLGAAEDLAIDVANVYIELVFISATEGWQSVSQSFIG
jgi:hypothetical protein